MTKLFGFDRPETETIVFVTPSRHEVAALKAIFPLDIQYLRSTDVFVSCGNTNAKLVHRQWPLSQMFHCGLRRGLTPTQPLKIVLSFNSSPGLAIRPSRKQYCKKS